MSHWIKLELEAHVLGYDFPRGNCTEIIKVLIYGAKNSNIYLC